MKRRLFASDNFAGIHPEILRSIQKANDGHVMAYGDDSYTEKAVAVFREHFGKDLDVFFVSTGTAANVLGLQAVMKPYESLICPESAHIHTSENGALENFVGCKVITVATQNGKITSKQIEPHLEVKGDKHASQPRVISISQTTEFGGIYTPAEVRVLSEFAHQNGLLLHMDGARLANSAAALGCSLRSITSDVGVDVLSFGGTKNGMMLGEAVVLFGKARTDAYEHIQKQGLQLCSKMRFIACQFIALLSSGVWLENAMCANRMAKLLAKRVSQEVKEVTITQPVEANAVFAKLPEKALVALQKKSFYWIWNSKEHIARWMTSWDTTEQDIDEFITLLKQLL